MPTRRNAQQTNRQSRLSEQPNFPPEQLAAAMMRRGSNLYPHPYPSDEMICWPVSARVGSVKNNNASLINPVAA